MVRAIVDNCLPKVSRAVAMPTEGLERQGAGRGYRSADGSVIVLDPTPDFACQVMANADPGPVSEDLAAWAEQAGFALVGRVPLVEENQLGLFVFGRAEAGGYIQIHVSNLPEGRLGALLTRMDQNREAERALRQ